MNIEGRIAIDVSFADSATSDGVQSLKKISLTDTTSYTTGKVAIVTGTCGTAAVAIAPSATGYKDANGNEVDLIPTRLAFSATPAAYLNANDTGERVYSSNGKIAVSETRNGDDSLDVFTTAGTASYTLVLYGT